MNKPDPTPGERKYRVLLVDDEPWMLKLMAAVLSMEAEVVSCASGPQALALLEAQSFDVVCSDYRMPGMDGLALLRAVSLAWGEMSRLLITAADDLMTAGAGGEHQVLLKPFDPDRLTRVVVRLARLAQAKRAASAAASRPEPSPAQGRPKR